MMQTLPFLAAKSNMAKGAIDAVSSKQSEAPKGVSFQQLLSKQVAQEEAKNKVDKTAAPTTQEKQLQESASIAEVGIQIDKTQNLPEELLQDTTTVDAQQLALETTAKTVQDVTDGQVVLAVPQAEIVQRGQAPVVNAASVTQAADQANRKGDMLAPKRASNLVEVTSDNVKKDTSSNPQKVDAKAESQQLENDQFVQTLVAESKIKSLKETALGKANFGQTETSAIASVSIQQPAAKFSATPIQQAGSGNEINAYPGKTGWNEAVSQKVVWMVGATEQTAKLTLNPPELGPLEVIIQVNNEKADATFISENPVVRQALEEGVATLRQLMGQAGVELGQANVNTSKQQQEFQQANREQLTRQSLSNTDNQHEENTQHRPAVIRESNGLVDTFA